MMDIEHKFKINDTEHLVNEAYSTADVPVHVFPADQIQIGTGRSQRVGLQTIITKWISNVHIEYVDNGDGSRVNARPLSFRFIYLVDRQFNSSLSSISGTNLERNALAQAVLRSPTTYAVGAEKIDNLIIPHNYDYEDRFIYLHDEVVDVVPFAPDASPRRTISHSFSFPTGISQQYSSMQEYAKTNAMFMLCFPIDKIVAATDLYPQIRVINTQFYADQ